MQLIKKESEGALRPVLYPPVPAGPKRAKCTLCSLQQKTSRSGLTC